MQFDDLYKHVPEVGRYQTLLMVILMTPYIFTDTIALNFSTARMSHWCHVPELSHVTPKFRRYVSAPYRADGDGYDGCAMFDVNYTMYAPPGNGSGWERPGNGSGIVPCQHGWEYDRSQYQESTVSAFDLVCSKSHLGPFPGSVFFAGAMIGTVVVGLLSDRFGRRIMYLVLSMVQVVSYSLAAWSPAFWVFCLAKFIQGFCSNGLYLCGYIIMTELVGPGYRSMFTAIYSTSWTMSYFLCAGLGYHIRDFRILQATFAAPKILFVFIYCVLPEPPRWLIHQNRLQDASDVFRRISSINKTPIPPDLDRMLQTIRKSEVEMQGDGRRKNLCHVFSSRILLRRTLAIYLHWFVAGLMYYSLALNAGSLSGNIYLNTGLMSLVHVPAILCFVAAVNRRPFGRRLTALLSMLAAGLCALCVSLAKLGGGTWTHVATAFALIGKIFIIISFESIYFFTAESAPTEVRHIVLGSSSFCGRLGAMLAPYMGPSMSDIWDPLPSTIFGILALVAGFYDLVLPETMGLPMAQTIEEAEKRAVQCCGIPEVENVPIPDLNEKHHRETSEKNFMLSNSVVGTDTEMLSSI